MSTKPNTSITSTNNTKVPLEKGGMVNVCGASYIVGGANRSQVQLTHCNTNVMQVHTSKQIEEEFLNGTVSFPERPGAGARVGTANDNFQCSLDLCPEADMEKALRFKEYMEAIDREYPGRISTKELLRISYEVAEKIADPSVPSKDTLRKYLKRWKNSGGDIRSLLPLTHRRGNRKSRLDPNIDVMIYDAISNLYACPEQPSTTAVYNALCSKVTRVNERSLPQNHLLMPSKKALMKAIRKRMGPDMLAARKG